MVVADRASRKPPPPPPPPMFSLPPRFTPPPMFTPPPPMFTLPPPPPPPPRTITPADRRNMNSVGVPPPIHPALKDRVDSSGNLRVTADTAERLIQNYKPATPPYFVPPPMFTPPMFSPPMFTVKPPPVTPPPPRTEDPVQEAPAENNPPPPPPVYSQPSLPSTPPPPPPPPKIKVAPIDTVLFDDDAVPKEIIADLLFENIGGQEILTIARHDTVNGQTVLYQPIKNINILQQQYNPNNLLKLRDTSDTIFGNFTINLSAKIPQIGNGPNGSNTYIDSQGNIIIEFINLATDELIEVQLTSSGTIYEAG